MSSIYAFQNLKSVILISAIFCQLLLYLINLKPKHLTRTLYYFLWKTLNQACFDPFLIRSVYSKQKKSCYKFKKDCYLKLRLNSDIYHSQILSPFAPNEPFLYPLKTSENRKVFSCFQGVEKGSIANKWVNSSITFNDEWKIAYTRMMYERLNYRK